MSKLTISSATASDTSVLFDEYGDKYDLWYEKYYHTWISELELVRRFKCSGRSLEVGIGSGRFGPYIGVAVGLDPSLKLLKKVRGVDKVLGYGEYLPFRDDSFECTYIIFTICFVRDPDGVIREALRVSSRVITCIVPRDSFLGQKYLKEAEGGHIFYSKARFYTVEEIISMFSKYGAVPRKVLGTLTDYPENIKYIDKVYEIASLDEVSKYGLVCVEFVRT